MSEGVIVLLYVIAQDAENKWLKGITLVINFRLCL